MAICGTTCSITVDGSATFQGHKFTINTAADDIDVRTFGSGAYGDWLACAKNGTIAINSYMSIDGMTPGNDADIVCSIGTKTLTANNCQCTGADCDVDSKAVVEWTYTFRLTGDITGW